MTSGPELSTPEVAKPIQSGYGGLYVLRARRAFPLLVQLARAGRTITYGDLAPMLDMPNPRNLNYVLGCVGASLDALRNDGWDQIPPLQSIVVNRGTGDPGRGFDEFLKRWFHLEKIPARARPALLRDLQQDAFRYQRWTHVLLAIGLKPSPSLDSRATVTSLSRDGQGGGESAEHLALKNWLAGQPALFRLPRHMRGNTEFDLESGDCMDVVFESPQRIVGLEAKSRVSSVGDLLRGVFQCVKYLAVLEARTRWRDRTARCEVFLALEAEAPRLVREAAVLLGVSLMDRVRERASER